MSFFPEIGKKRLLGKEVVMDGDFNIPPKVNVVKAWFPMQQVWGGVLLGNG